MSACIFCKIINKEIPSQLLFEDDSFIVIRDIQPHAKEHLLIIPKQHFATLDEADENGSLLSLSKNWINLALQMAKQIGIEKSGYRLLINQREDGGQTVFHLHMHLLGGEKLSGKLA